MLVDTLFIIPYTGMLCYNICMTSTTGGQSSSDLQRRAASALARKKVLAAYAKMPTNVTRSDNSHLKSEPIEAKISSESWKKYHSAWQNYYQRYYSDYYSAAAQNYIKNELKNGTPSIAKQTASDFTDQRDASQSFYPTEESAGGPDNSESSNPWTQNFGRITTIRNTLRKKIREKNQKSTHVNQRYRRFTPLLAGIAVVIIVLFLQYNRLIFAPMMAYVSPGDSPASSIEAIDPTITQTVSPEPRLLIPKLNIDVPVHFGITLDEVMPAMANGVAHYRISGASAFPGEIGNFVITGHSAGDVYSSNPYKYIFSGLERLDDGDLIYVNYNSTRYTYRVVRKEVVEPTNVAALTVDTDKPILTLVTCTPLGTSRYRLLVFAEQISPSTETAGEMEQLTTEAETESLPANEPSFFENIWNFLTGQ